MTTLFSITDPYLLVTGIKCYLDKNGHHYVDPLWHKDLVEHCRYLKNLTLAAPVEYKEDRTNLVELEADPICSAIHFDDMPNPNSFLNALWLLPKTITHLWKGIGKTSIVHSGVANWPIPYGWLVAPIARIKNKYHVMMIESAFWRIPPGVKVSTKTRVRSAITEKLNQWSVNQADLPLFTEQSYLNTLLTNSNKKGHVIHASWIDEDNVLSEGNAKTIWNNKNEPAPFKLLFAGQLNVNKGVQVLLDAFKEIAAENLPIEIDILGAGELQSTCLETSAQYKKISRLNILGTVPYGNDFFKILQNYHALVTPNLTDEQPRVVYDAYSQALPVLASCTPGLVECVFEGETGRLVEPNNPVALAELFRWSLNNRQQLEMMGMNALKKASRMTHQHMHAQRLHLLLEMLNHSD